MEKQLLQFQGSTDQGLLTMLLAAVCLALATWAVVQFIGRRWRQGVVAAAAAFGPLVALPVLIGDGVRQMVIGQSRTAKGSFLAAAGLLAACLLLLGAMYMSGFTAGGFWLAALSMQVVLAVGVFYSSVYSYLGTRRMALLMSLRCVAILILMAILFKPVLSLMPSAAPKPHLSILLDRSGSMSTIDQGDPRTRYARSIEALAHMRPRIERYFQPAWYHFGGSLEYAKSLDELAQLPAGGGSGNATDLSAAIRDAAVRFPRSDQAGLLVVSDGINNASTEAALKKSAAEAGLAVMAAGVGSSDAGSSGVQEVHIASVTAPMEAIVNNVATIKALVKVSGHSGVPIVVSLVEEGGKTLSERLVPQANVVEEPVTFRWTPTDAADGAGKSANIRKLTLTAGPENDPASLSKADIHVMLTNPQIRVLYVEGSIRPEYRSLSRLLKTDPNVEAVCMVRMSGNSFVADGKVAGRQLSALPATEEEFKLFSVIIIGDLDRSFLSDQQLALLHKFVNDGGGLIVMGGTNSFGPGGYADTELEQVLPVKVGPRSQGQETTAFTPQLTAAGQTHPIFEGLLNYFPGPEGAPIAAEYKLRDLDGCVNTVMPAPGAAVLAVHPTRRNQNGPLTVLAVQQVGGGRCAAFTADTTRHWDVERLAMGAASPFGPFWGQMIRYVASVQTRQQQTAPAVVLRLDGGQVRSGKEFTLLARVQDSQGKAPENASMSVTIASASSGQVVQTVAMKPAGRGLFEASGTIKGEGAYRLAATATAADGKTLATDELTVAALADLAEMQDLARRQDLLDAVAAASGGHSRDLRELGDLVDRLIQRQSTQAQTPKGRTIHLHHLAGMFIIFVALLTCEWVLRRRWQLH